MTAAVFLNFAARFQRDNIARVEGFLLSFFFFPSFFFLFFFQN